jgi:hypothetical protein
MIDLIFADNRLPLSLSPSLSDSRSTLSNLTAWAVYQSFSVSLLYDLRYDESEMLRKKPGKLDITTEHIHDLHDSLSASNLPDIYSTLLKRLMIILLPRRFRSHGPSLHYLFNAGCRD